MSCALHLEKLENEIRITGNFFLKKIRGGGHTENNRLLTSVAYKDPRDQ